MSYARAFLLAAVVCAERIEAQGLFVGIRAGQATARQYWRGFSGCDNDSCFVDSRGKTDPRIPGLTGGFVFTFEWTSWLALETDLLFVEKGMRDPGSELRIEYLELPVLLRFGVPLSDQRLRVFVHGGPAPAAEISCSARVIFGQPPTGFPEDCKRWRETKRDLGWVSGVGVLLRQPAYQVSFSWRHTEGLRDLARRERFMERFNDSRAFFVGFGTRVK